MAVDEPVRGKAQRPAVLLRRGRILESITLGWNAVGMVVLAVAPNGLAACATQTATSSRSARDFPGRVRRQQ